MGRQCSSSLLSLLLVAAATWWVDAALPQVTRPHLLIPDLRVTAATTETHHSSPFPGQASTLHQDDLREYRMWWKDSSRDWRGKDSESIEVTQHETEKVSFPLMQEQQQQLQSSARRLTPIKLPKHHHCEAFNTSMPGDLLAFSRHHSLGTQRQLRYSHDGPTKARRGHSGNHHHSSFHRDHYSHFHSFSHRKHHQGLQRKRRSHHNLKKRHQNSQAEGIRRWPLLQFSQSEYRRTVTEDLPLHTSILTVSVEGAGPQEQAQLQYHLSDTENFGVDEAGVIYNLRRLDHETSGGRYTVQVTAEQRGGGRRWPRPAAAVIVQVQDAPETPTFDSSHYHFTISEFALKGSYVGRVRASDDDNDLDHYFLDGAEPANAFSIDPASGVVTLSQAPDGSRWEFNFQAGASDRHGHVALVPVTVYILASNPSYDDNQHSPVFPECQSYNDIHVTENVTAGSPVLLVLATDQDSGRSGSVSYSLIHSFGSFAIHASNQHGQITTTRRLDRDGEDKEFFLTVIAKDSGTQPRQTSCSFRVVVEDVNDNPPVFDQAKYEQTLATDHNPATPVLRVSASDRDSGSNARVTYHLEGHPNHLEFFYLEPMTGVLSLKRSLNATMANAQTFDLGVRAVDGGTPPLWSMASVSIPVVSSGELPPTVVGQHPRQPAIPENTTESTEVVVLCARSNIGSSPNVYFTLLNGNTPSTNSEGTFAIRRLPDHQSAVCGDSSGVSIFVATRTLDYEFVQAYKLNLQIVNDRNARLEQQVMVTIVDVNDNAPLLQPFDGAVRENTDSMLITTIQAVDKDASPQYRQLTYSFDVTASNDVISKFALKTNGELWTTQPLDREEVSQYRVPIQVTDGVPAHERMTTYWITVQDLNDVAPQFDLSNGVYEVQLPENREPGKPTGVRLHVDDEDIVNHFTFEIVEGNEEKKFRVDPSARTILVNKPLDYDYPVMDRNFTLRVRVSDGENAPALTDVVVAVVNVNDLQPVFQRSNYTFVVTENTDCSLPLGQVSALDPDLPPSVNQNILYYLSPDEQRNFTIDSRSGQLSIRGCLDREAAVRGTMTLYPRANDEGGKGHDADPATVQVTILDLNDNYPHIIKPPQSYARVMENVEPHLVEPVVIELGDADSEEHGCPCSLEFHTSTPVHIRDKFTLTPLGRSRYRLSPVTVLDREQQKVYRLAFTARDNAGRGGTRHLTLEVGDENDSPMSDGNSSIRVYNFQDQFPAMVIGSVQVTDDDDHDRQDKTFQVDASTSLEVASHFKVDLYTGDITMLRGTPSGTHVLRVKVHDNFRREMAIGEATISVVALTQEAVTHSGSLRLANTSAKAMLRRVEAGAEGTSLYERLKKQIARIHQISETQVDVFSLRDAPGNSGVDVRYNCHSSPYYTATRLNGMLLRKRQQVSAALGVDIPLVDINACLYEALSPCGGKSCQHTLRLNITAPHVVSGASTSLVGMDITDDYACNCGPLEPPPSVCYPGFCLNGGVCRVKNNTLTCQCPDSTNYGKRCELLTARFERGFAWYNPLIVCERSSLSLAFETNDKNGVLLYAGPTVPSPWPDYPRDFLYVILRDWVVETYLDFGTGTMNVSISIEASTLRTFQYVLTWSDGGVSAEVIDCGINITSDNQDPCRKTVPLARFSNNPSYLLNVQGPLQVGGIAAMVSFPQLADSYGWTLTPPSTFPFSGCVLELRHNDRLYDLNATDFHKYTFQPCDAPRTSRVVLGRQSIIIILASLLSLLLLVVVILCLARRGKKTVSYPDLDRELVKETMGGTDLEGFGEKDVTHFDLKFLQVTPDGFLVGDENEGTLPDVAQDACQRLGAAPIATMPEGLSIGDFIKENILKVDQEHQDVDDVRHYDVQGDEMSAASLSSLASGSSRSEMAFDYRTDWGQRFEKLAQIYRGESDAEDDSEYEFPDIPNKPSNKLFFPDNKSMSKANATEGQQTVSSSSDPPSHSPGIVTEGKPSSDPPLTTVPVKEPRAISLQSQSDPQESACLNKKEGDVSSSSSRKKDTTTLQQPSYPTQDSTKPHTPPPPPSPLPNKRQVSTRPPTPSRYSNDSAVTTITNLYTNPAQRSATLGRKKPLLGSSSHATKDDTNHRLPSDIYKPRSTEKTAPPQKSAEKKIEPRDSITPIATVKSTKGIETWC
ncbi:neural-cadherin-like isoform X2 [Portunus trituberculatus]|uniref:neural-cadherin-like isoform X2 n=1 Tax=Portunus trituberculatus TaxID=210409 RepID=UPI001E1D154A|nr:neural-cadherin-like isoform X2 [Portunus trituberculatus]